METITYLITALLAICGTIIGVIIGGMAKRELSEGARYFRALHDLLLSAALLTVLLAIKVPLPASALTAVTLLLVLRYAKTAPGSIATAAACGIMLWLAGNTDSMTLAAALIFLSGLPRGSLFAHQPARREVSRWLIVATLVSLLGALF